jgi:tetratricopeptide (TPR) repeat protein
VLQETLPVGESLVEEYPGNADYRHALAAAYGNLGGVDMLLERYDASAEAYRRELAAREPLVVDHPSVLDYRLKLASTYTNLGELNTRTGEPEAALPWYDKSIETLRRVLDREPQHAIGRFFLSYTHAWKARSLDALARHAEAAREWDLAIRYDDRDDPELLKSRTDSRRRAAS